MNVWVVIPVGPDFDRNHLEHAIDSCYDQTHRVTTLVVWDGSRPRLPVNGLEISLPNPSNDIGSTPRAVGSIYAFSQSADAVCWLDADNWLREDHVERLVDHQLGTGAPVVCSGRTITDQSGTRFAPCREMVPGTKWHDTNTFMVTRQAKGVAASWATIPDGHHYVGDRIVSKRAQIFGVSCHYEPTVFYRSSFRFHHEENNWPADGVDLKTLQQAADRENKQLTNTNENKNT